MILNETKTVKELYLIFADNHEEKVITNVHTWVPGSRLTTDVYLYTTENGEYMLAIALTPVLPEKLTSPTFKYERSEKWYKKNIETTEYEEIDILGVEVREAEVEDDSTESDL